MTIQIKHAFTSAKGDGTDATLVRPSNWNAVHTTSMATLNLLGRLTAGVGAFEEIPITAFMAAVLNSADANGFLAALGIGAFTTGDTKFSIDPTAQAGWIVYNLNTASGTIGDASSTATVRANADCSALFQMIWNSVADADCPVTGGRGANAAADFAAHKQIGLPWIPGRTVIGNAGGASLTTRVIGRVYGEETHLLTVAEIPSHTHANSLNDPGHTHSSNAAAANASTTGGGGFLIGGGNATINGAATNMSITNAAQGGGGAHNVMQPSISLWAKVKL
jgi:microcystin-dependent protein